MIRDSRRQERDGNPAELVSNRPLAAGGLMMGLGSSLAGGCNIGHGLTGLATLSAKSALAAAAIVARLALGLAWSERREVAAAL